MLINAPLVKAMVKNAAIIRIAADAAELQRRGPPAGSDRRLAVLDRGRRRLTLNRAAQYLSHLAGDGIPQREDPHLVHGRAARRVDPRNQGRNLHHVTRPGAHDQ